MPNKYGFELPRRVDLHGGLRTRCITCEQFFRLPLSDTAQRRHHEIHLRELEAIKLREQRERAREARRLKALAERESARVYQFPRQSTLEEKTR